MFSICECGDMSVGAAVEVDAEMGGRGVVELGAGVVGDEAVEVVVEDGEGGRDGIGGRAAVEGEGLVVLGGRDGEGGCGRDGEDVVGGLGRTVVGVVAIGLTVGVVTAPASLAEDDVMEEEEEVVEAMLASGAVVEVADAKSLTGEAKEAEELDWGVEVGTEMVMPTEEQTPWAKVRVSGWKSVSAALASVLGVGVGNFSTVGHTLNITFAAHGRYLSF